MTAEEKFLYNIRACLIEENEEFLELNEEEQNELIIAKALEFIEKMKTEK